MKSKVRYSCLILGLCALLAVAPVRAGTVTVNFLNGTPNAVTTIPETATAAVNMAGMTVTAYFSDASWEEETWAQISGDVYGAVGTGWQLSVDDSDTYYAPWDLTSTSTANTITKIAVDGGPGNTVFDVEKGNNPLNPGSSTPGSEKGRTLEVYDESSPLDITVTYSDTVQLAGSAPVGDVWRRMGLEFTNAGYFAPGSSLKFAADTDNVSGLNVVPTPPEWALLVMSLGVLSGYGLMKRRTC